MIFVDNTQMWLPLLSLLFVSLSLFSFRGSSAVKCTVDGYNPCRCILSDGYRGSVDLTPIFKDGPVFWWIHTNYPRLKSCYGSESYQAEWVDYYHGTALYVFGSREKLAKEWIVTRFLPEKDIFEFVVKYEASRHFYSLEITYTYDPTTDHDMVSLNSPGPNGLELHLKSKYVKPVLLAESDAVGGPVEDDVCARWERQRTTFAELGLLNLAAPVVRLNSTASTSSVEYHLGVCVNPLKDSVLSRNCTAVRRTLTNAKPEDVCIGTSSFAQLTDRRDQGWILLRYPYSDFVDDCNGYVVTEILFTCDRRDQASLSPVYPEDHFDVVCRYQFIWPTHLACPNLTSPSGGSPSSLNPSSILLGMSGSVLVLLLLVTVGVTVSTCYLYRRERTRRSVDLREPVTESSPIQDILEGSPGTPTNEEEMSED